MAVRINGTKIPRTLFAIPAESGCTTKPGRSGSPQGVLHQKITVRNHRESSIHPHQSIHVMRVSRVLTSSPGQILFDEIISPTMISDAALDTQAITLKRRHTESIVANTLFLIIISVLSMTVFYILSFI